MPQLTMTSVFNKQGRGLELTIYHIRALVCVLVHFIDKSLQVSIVFFSLVSLGFYYFAMNECAVKYNKNTKQQDNFRRLSFE